MDVHSHDTQELSSSNSRSAFGTMTTGNSNKQPGLQADFKIAGSYVVQITMTPLGRIDGTHPAPDAEAEITWKVKGNNVVRRVSIANGVTVQGVCQSVAVRIIDVTDLGGNDSIDYAVSMLVAPGTRGSTEQPPTLVTDDNTAVPSQGDLDIPVPENVGVISVLVTAIRYGAANNTVITQPLPGYIQVVQEDAQGAALKVYDPRDYGFMPLSPGCANLKFRNYEVDLADTALGVSVTFGIDG